MIKLNTEYTEYTEEQQKKLNIIQKRIYEGNKKIEMLEIQKLYIENEISFNKKYYHMNREAYIMIKEKFKEKM